MASKGSGIYNPAFGTTTTFTFSATGSWSVCNPTTIANAGNVNFTTSANGRLTYTGANTTMMFISITLTYRPSSAGVQRIIGLQPYKNGIVSVTIPAVYSSPPASTTDFECVTVSGLYSMATNDYVEGYIANMNNSSSILIQSYVIAAIGPP